MFADSGITLFSSLKVVVLVFLRIDCSGVTVPEILVEESGCPVNLFVKLFWICGLKWF